MNSITDFLKCTGNPLAQIAEKGVIAGDVEGWVDSGSYAFNALISGDIYGGFPQNKITALAADSGTGKTYFALGAAKNFLQQHPEGMVICFESEAAITKQMLVDRGIDVKRFGVVPVTTVQEFRTQAIKVVDNYEKQSKDERKPLLFLLDSLGMLSTTKEIEDTAAGSETKDMSRAGMIKATFRVLTLKLGRANVPMIVTNHVYADVGGGPYAGKVVGGGSGLIYSSSTILTMSKAKDKDEASGEIKGVVITLTATKSRLTKENSKVKCMIRYDGGLDRYYGLLDIAEASGAFKKVSTRYELPDGTKIFGSQIMKDPEKYFTKDVLDKINVYVKEKFCYGTDGEFDATAMDEESAQEPAKEQSQD